MQAYGSAHHVAGREPIPLPTQNQPITPRERLVVCPCGHRGRLGTFHICIDLSAPEPVVIAPPKPAPKKVTRSKPGTKSERPANTRPPRKPRDCVDCGAPISKVATRCLLCAGKLRGATPRASTGPIVSRIEEVKRRYLAGERVQDLADDLGVGASGIRAALRRSGVTLRSQSESQRGRRGRRGLTDEQANEVVRMYVEDRMTMDAIGEHFGIGQHGIRNTLQRLGVERRRRGGPGNRKTA